MFLADNLCPIYIELKEEFPFEDQMTAQKILSDVKIYPESELFLHVENLSETQATKKFPSEQGPKPPQLEPYNMLPAVFWEKSLDFEPKSTHEKNRKIFHRIYETYFGIITID